MARRRRTQAGGVEAVAALLLVGVPLVLILAVISVIAHNPALLVLLLAGGGGLIAWRVNVRRRRAEMRHRQAESLATRERIAANLYAARAQAIASYDVMNAHEFEDALAWLCRRDGCPEAIVTGKTGDLGADVRAITPDGRILIIQAKRYAARNLVTGPDLQKFGGTCYAVHRAQIAAAITTSGYTKQAQQYAAAMRIVLFGHDALAGWIAQNGPPPWAMVPPPVDTPTPPGEQPHGRHTRQVS
jgi:restriction system protein